MEILDFFKKFLVQTVLALSLWCLALLGLNFLLPGFVTSFIDLPDIGLIIFALLLITLSWSEKNSSVFGKVINILLLIVILILVAMVLWTRISQLGYSGLLLETAAVVTAGILIYALNFENN